MSLLPESELHASLQTLAGWHYDPTAKALQRQFELADFKAAMRFVNAVAEAAEKADHHPDIDVRYNKVKISTWSHDAGGVTARDVRLARAIQRLAEE